MTKHILFIHGAGEGAYEEDKLLADSLQKELGLAYAVHYPMMHDESNAPYAAWKEQVVEEISAVQTPIILIGHSVGGSYLAKILTQIKVSTPVSGVFLLGSPFWGGAGWRYEGYKELELPSDTSIKFQRDVKLFLYHTRDDEVVPFSHLSLYVKLIPQASIRDIDKGGHQFSNGLSLLAKILKTMISARV